MSLYHSINCLLVLAILVLLYVPNSPKVVITTCHEAWYVVPEYTL